MEVRDLIKQRRIELGLTQEEVAKHVGVSETTVSRWESGQISNMGHRRIVLLAEILQIKPAAFMGWTEEKPSPPTHPKLSLLHSRSRALTDKQLDIINSLVDEMVKEHDAFSK